jgi:hypothetical protein
MSDIMCWMINPRGGPRRVDSGRVEELKRAGWYSLPMAQLTESGEPKQTYYPQYDVTSTAKTTPIEEAIHTIVDVLEVELI